MQTPQTTQVVIYASVDALDWFPVAASPVLDRDITLQGTALARDGTYRLVCPEYLGWIRQRISEALRNPRSNPQFLSLTIEFYHAIRDASGLEPSRDVPAGYSKPQAQQPVGPESLRELYGLKKHA